MIARVKKGILISQGFAMISKFLQKFVYLLENYIPVVCKQKL